MGDLVQCLYTWRGAKPKQLVELGGTVAPREVRPLPLTRSFRFGEGVARVANHLLFIKKSSKQRALWHPYAIVGAGPATVAIHEAEMAPPYTAISRTNVALAFEAWRLLSEAPGVTILVDTESTRTALTSTCDQLLKLAPNHEEEADFEFKRTTYSGWGDFVEQCDEREETLLLGCIAILDKLGKEAVPDLVQRLRQVLSCREPDADARQVVRLTNACQAKGLEWDRVKVLGGLYTTACYSCYLTYYLTTYYYCTSPTLLTTYCSVPTHYLLLKVLDDFRLSLTDFAKDARETEAELGWGGVGPTRMEFTLDDYSGDELNNLYVACTRARTELQMPKIFWELHNLLWHGVEPEGYGQYSPAETSGIEQLLESMRKELPPPAAGAFGEPRVGSP